jgi:glycosyltransferase involved in cell wall biosynthesis
MAREHLCRGAQEMKKVVFIETWTNPIYVRFANEFAKQFPQYKVYFITDSDSIGKNVFDPLSPKVTVVPLENIKLTRKLVFLPLYLASFVSKKAKSMYADTIYLHTYKHLHKALDKIKPDLIQSNVLLMPFTMQAGRYARKHDIPFIMRTEEQHVGTWLRGKLIAAATLLNRKSIRHASYVLPWTIQGVAFVHSRFPPARKKVVLLPAGVDTKLFTPKRTYATQGPIKLLTVQRFVPYKDYPTLLHGVRTAIDSGADLTLAILGSGPEEENIKALIAELKLTTHVKLLAAVPYKKMGALMRQHDALVHTGRYEAIGMVVPEAMACGVPAVVCDTAGAVTYVDPKTGMTFAMGDSGDLAKKLLNLNHPLIMEMGRAAAKKVHSRYATSVIVKEYGKLIQPLLAHK